MVLSCVFIAPGEHSQGQNICSCSDYNNLERVQP